MGWTHQRYANYVEILEYDHVCKKPNWNKQPPPHLELFIFTNMETAGQLS